MLVEHLGGKEGGRRKDKGGKANESRIYEGDERRRDEGGKENERKIEGG